VNNPNRSKSVRHATSLTHWHIALGFRRGIITHGGLKVEINTIFISAQKLSALLVTIVNNLQEAFDACVGGDIGSLIPDHGG
jgi:hypothetical protein